MSSEIESKRNELKNKWFISRYFCPICNSNWNECSHGFVDIFNLGSEIMKKDILEKVNIWFYKDNDYKNYTGWNLEELKDFLNYKAPSGISKTPSLEKPLNPRENTPKKRGETVRWDINYDLLNKRKYKKE